MRGMGQRPKIIKMQKHTTGLIGEDIAAEYLEKEGFTVIARRYRTGHLETDIIASNGEYILFTEVKTRRERPDVAHPYGTPGDAVTPSKRKNLISAAEQYLKAHKEETAQLQPRIDVIEVYLDPTSETPRLLRLNHYKNAVRKHRTEAR